MFQTCIVISSIRAITWYICNCCATRNGKVINEKVNFQHTHKVFQGFLCGKNVSHTCLWSCCTTILEKHFFSFAGEALSLPLGGKENGQFWN